MPRQLWCLFMTSFSGLFIGSFWQVLKAHNLIVKTSDKGAFRKGQCMYQSLFDKVEVQSGCLWIYRESFAARILASRSFQDYIVEAASSSLARCKPQILRGTTNHRSTPSNLYRSQYSREDKRRKLAGAVNAEVAAAAKECTSDPVQFPQSRRKAANLAEKAL